MAVQNYIYKPKDNAQTAQKMGPPAPSNTQGVQSVPNNQAGGAQSMPAVQNANGTGVRQGLVNMGLDNGKIGWNGQTGMVTYNGKDYLKPSSVSDGTSYASDADIRKMAASVYQDSGNPLQVGTDYFSNKGISNAVQYSGDGIVSIGGKAMKPVSITSDGKALFKTSDLEAAYSDYAAKNGIKSNQDIYNDYQNKYGGRIEDALSKITDRDPWSYSAENDPAYRAYRDAYTREGNRALQDAVGNMSAMTGGYTSSAAATAGLQAQNYYMQQLGDRIPELMANDYDRYLGEQQLNQAALNSLLGVSNDDYSKQYKANRDTINDVNAANDASWNRDMQNKQWNDSHALNQAALEQANIQNKYLPQELENALYRDNITNKYYEDNQIADLAGKQLANNGQEQANADAVWNAALKKAQLQNNITPELGAALGLEPNADGSYVSPWNAEIGYNNSVALPYQQALLFTFMI